MEELKSPARTARITGLMYLFIIICAGFSEGIVRGSLIVAGDAPATAQNIAASESLFRLGFVSDLVAFLLDLIVSILLYQLLKPVNKTLSLIAAALRLLAHPAIASMNLLNHYAPLLILNGDGYLSGFNADQANALVLLFLDLQNYGYLIAGAFFGLHLLILGYLLYKSELFPGILGILMYIASAGYLLESFGGFLAPQHLNLFALLVGISAVLGEVTFTFWLLIKGTKTESLVRN